MDLLTQMNNRNGALGISTNHTIGDIAQVVGDRLEEFLREEFARESDERKVALERVDHDILSLQETVREIVRDKLDENRKKHVLNGISSLENGWTRLRSEYSSSLDKFRRAFARSLHLVHTDIRALHGYINDTLFPQFMKLPHEIRAMIWDLAIPGRPLGVSWMFEDTPSVVYGFDMLSPPSMASVCQESRAVACRSGRLVRNCNTIFPMTYSEWSWFDPSRDSLCFLEHDGEHLPNEAALEPVRCTQHVTFAIPMGYKQEIYCKYIRLLEPHLFPHLKTVDFVVGQYTHQDNVNCNRADRLFEVEGKDGPFAIDLNDETAMKALIYRGKRDHSHSDVGKLEMVQQFESRSKLWGRRVNYPTRHAILKMDRCDFLKSLEEKWILVQYHRHPLGGGGGDVKLVKVLGEERPGLSEDWVNVMLRSRPVFRRVLLFEAAPSKPPDMYI
ncbi:hypothetical protein F4677DRAFT_126518 [Hypoxylon crocopeplum]|nr:hypothetical protein F4677DRAFT_126518 [Hypoxylon crocopeplum]